LHLSVEYSYKITKLNLDLTIVSVNKNNFTPLMNTLNSIRDLNFNEKIRHLIVDGNSRDLVEDFNQLKNRYNFDFISEDDTGIYNAMNKGISLSKCNHILFLNSGDTIINPINFKHLLSECSEIDIVYSNIYKLLPDEDKSVECRFPENLSLDYMICYGLPHQATIIKKSLFNQVGFYNENYKIISDWVFFMESLFFHNATYKYVDVTAINFDGSGISNQTKFLRTIIIEQLDYISRRFPTKVSFYKDNSPYVKKYFRTMPRWKKYFLKRIFMNFNIL
jgi:hypothetical protein